MSAPLPPPPRALRLRRGHDGALCESLHDVPRHSQDRPHQEKGVTLSGMGPSLSVEGSTTTRVFETYVEKVLLASLEEGQIVVMDNLSAHRPKRIRDLIEI
jgi:hypothetical protein